MSAGPGGNTSSPKDCAVCNHSGKVSQCPGCGGLLGYKQWPPCAICHGVIGVNDPLPPPGAPLLDQIEATEPRTLPPLEAFAAEAATNVDDDPNDVLAYEIQCLKHDVLNLENKIDELSARITALTQAVLGRNHHA